GRAQIVRLAADAPVCLDPMRVFAGDERAVVATGFLTLLAQVAPTDLEGVAIAEAVESACAHQDATIGAVVAELERLGQEDGAARTVFRKVRAMARSRLAGLVFDADRELLAIDADYLVFHTPGLALPRREDLAASHLSPQLLPEQVLSQALLYLVAAITRQVTFSDWSRFAAACLDEAWALTASLQGRQLVLDFVRDGRKHNAAVWLLSQHADDLGDDQLAHLLGSRFVFRQDPGAVPAALRFLGIDGDSAAGELLTHAQSGQALFRDGDGRVGFIQVLPADPDLHAAFDTNPSAGPRVQASGEAPGLAALA
ncbi:MAG: ATP-binding protein, partial [Egibacteraceae bacterium]